MKTLKLSVISAAVIAAMGMSSAFAVTQDDSGSTVQVNSSTSVADKCTTLTGGSISFAAYVPDASTANDGATTVSVRCTKGTSVTISMDAGSGTGATETTRVMESGDDTLEYSLYTDSSRSDVWGTGAAAVTFDGDGLLSTTSLPVYGRIAAGQDVTPGSFTDSVTVTLTY